MKTFNEIDSQQMKIEPTSKYLRALFFPIHPKNFLSLYLSYSCFLIDFFKLLVHWPPLAIFIVLGSKYFSFVASSYTSIALLFVSSISTSHLLPFWNFLSHKLIYFVYFKKFSAMIRCRWNFNDFTIAFHLPKRRAPWGLKTQFVPLLASG